MRIFRWITDRLPRPMLRVSLSNEQSGAWFIEERETFIPSGGDEYRVSVVWLSRRDLDRLGEFEGF